MNEKNVTDFYKEEVPSFASYDLIRKCSSYIDGFKNAHRKIIWTMLENFGNPNTRTKTSQMSATVSLKSMYLHGVCRFSSKIANSGISPCSRA